MALNIGVASLAGLQEIVGVEHAREATETDAIDGVRARFVVAPGSVAEVSAVMRLAHGAGLAVAPRGGGTKIGWGNKPTRLDLILSTARLNRVLEHAAGDLVVRAEAGVTLEALQETVASAGQRLALNPPERQATLGGIVAANPSGPLRLRYGTVRDLLIGITVVLADGTVAKAGGKVVKNVAGYDLCKLYTGSLGTLGIIVETIWRLHPLPAARRTVAVELATPQAAGAAVQALLHAPLSPLALDALELRWAPSPPTPLPQGARGAIASDHAPGYTEDGSPLPRVGRGVGGEGIPGGEGLLAVLFEGIEPGVVAQARAAETLLAEYGVARALTADEQDALWREAVAYPWQHGDVGLKLAHPPAALPAVLQDIMELAGAHAIVTRITGHAGTGVTLVALTGGEVTALPAVIAELRERVARAEGSVVVPQALLDIKEKLDVWGPVGDALPLMRRVKERFDPAGILNPGRFVGGI